MTDREWMAEQFEELRGHLRAVAYGMLGSMTEAEDAVQECWLRLDRSDANGISDLRAWLTTVVGRICLDMLRARQSRRDRESTTWLPEPLVVEEPEAQAELVDSIGLALLVVLESLTPQERLSFVLHDVFGLSFTEIGRIIDRTPDSARQLASRARRRVRSAPQPDVDIQDQRRVVDAFLAAARHGDFDALMEVLAPDVVLRFDLGPAPAQAVPQETVYGAAAVAARVLETAPQFIHLAKPVLVNGSAGARFGRGSLTRAVLGFTVVDGRIRALDLMADPAKLNHAGTN
jgi:RNA polymerase sigma-70 factor (ECF subfamily)